MPFFTQAAWDDTRTGQMLLTAGFRNEVSPLPKWTSLAAVPRASVSSWGPHLPRTVGRGAASNPICRYSY